MTGEGSGKREYLVYRNLYIFPRLTFPARTFVFVQFCQKLLDATLQLYFWFRFRVDARGSHGRERLQLRNQGRVCKRKMIECHEVKFLLFIHTINRRLTMQRRYGSVVSQKILRLRVVALLDFVARGGGLRCLHGEVGWPTRSRGNAKTNIIIGHQDITLSTPILRSWRKNPQNHHLRF